MSAPSTQDHLPIAGIQDNIVIMNDASVRVVLKVEPINFELKSTEEQDSIIYSYQAFLNSLDFPVQIVIQSKRLDLEQYLVRMQENLKQQTNDLLRIQTEDYIGFVRRLISVANIMAKRFYVVISHSAITKNSSISQFTSIFPHKNTGPLLEQDEFDRLRNEAFNKAGIIVGGLGRIGAKAEPLDTQALIELFYGIYNPDVATEERLTDLANLNSGVVTSPEATSFATAELPEAQGVPVHITEESLDDEPPQLPQAGAEAQVVEPPAEPPIAPV